MSKYNLPTARNKSSVKKYLRTLLCFTAFASTTPLLGVNYMVTSTADTNTAGTLRNAINLANESGVAGNTITFTTAGTINLAQSLPPISPFITTINANGNAVVINGSGTHQAFFVYGIPGSPTTVTIEGTFTLMQCASRGGAGGSNGFGGGGALGAGGGLFVSNGSQVTLQGVAFGDGTTVNGCFATGGAGGNPPGVAFSSGAGGGGMCGGTGGSANNTGVGIAGGGGGGGYSSAGGAGGTASATCGGGGGGGLFLPGGPGTQGGGGGGSDVNAGGGSPGQNGGIGGTGASGSGGAGGTAGPTGGAGGAGTFASGGGGGGLGTSGVGGAGGNTDTNKTIGGGAGGGGGGASTGGAGGTANSPFGGGGGGGSTSSGGASGSGGVGGAFAGGGGGGGIGGMGSAGGNGGFGGGGGGTNTLGTGGTGGFGAGGGSPSGTSTFGGGTAGISGGGGGAALGGSIFVGSGATLTIASIPQTSITSGTSTAGTGGAGAGSGQALGPDIFLSSSGTINFTQSTAFTINTPIASQNVTGGGAGGITMNGTGSLTLTANNTYTGTTTITKGILSVSNDNNFGNIANPITFNGVTATQGELDFTASVTLSGARNINMSGPGIIGLGSGTVTVPGLIQGGGGMLTINGPGTFVPSNSNNTYSAGTTIEGNATVQISNPRNLGAASAGNPLTFHAGTTGATLELLPAFGNATFSNPITMSGVNVNTATIHQDVSGTALHSTFSSTVALNGPMTISQTGAAAATSTLTFSGVISGAGAGASLTQSGSGILRLINTGNTYAGGTNFNGGTVQVLATGNLGTGPLTFNGGTLEISGPFQGAQTMVFNAPGGTIQVDNGISGTLSGTSSGAGGLTTVGPGQLFLAGTNNYMGTTTVQSGTLNVKAGGSINSPAQLEIQNFATLTVDGTVTSPILVDFGGTLKGTGTVGNVIINGIIAPGDSIGTIHGSTFTFNPSSSYYLELNNSTSDLIAATTSVTINGGTLRLFPINFTTPTVNSYTIITAPTVIVTVPFVFVNPLPRFMFTVVYEPTDVRLTLNQPPIPFRTIVPFGNAGAVAECFDVLVDENLPDLNDVVAIINLQTVSEIEHSLNQMQPSNFNNIYLAEENVAERIRQLYTDHFFEQRVINCPDTEAWRIWAAPFIERTRQHGSGKHPGYLERFSGFSLATDYQFEKHWMITGGFSYAGTEMNVPGARTNAHFKTYAGTLGAAWTDSHFFADALFSYLYSPVEAKRKMVFAINNYVGVAEATRTAKHHDHSNQVLGHLGGGYDFSIKASEQSSVNIYPFVNLDYIYIPQDGYTEHGAGSLDLKVKSKQYDLLRPEGGFGIGYKGCFELVEAMLDLSVSYVGEFRFSGKKTKASFEPASCTFSVKGLKPQNNLISPSARLRITSPINGYSITLGYHGEYGSHFIQNTGEAELRKSF